MVARRCDMHPLLGSATPGSVVLARSTDACYPDCLLFLDSVRAGEKLRLHMNGPVPLCLGTPPDELSGRRVVSDLLHMPASARYRVSLWCELSGSCHTRAWLLSRMAAGLGEIRRSVPDARPGGARVWRQE